jgi:hypothetical protein
MANNETDSTLALYADFDLKALDEDIEEAKKAGKSGAVVKLEQGKTVLRMLPARTGASHAPKPWRTVWKHFIQVPGLERKVIFNCPSMNTNGKMPCPACTMQRRKEQSANQLEREIAKDLAPQREVVANVLQRAAPELGIKPWPFKVTIHKALQALRDDINFVDPIRGIDLIVTKIGKDLETKYNVGTDPKGPSPLCADNAQLAELLKTMPDLDRYADSPTASEIESMLAGERPARETRRAGAGARGGSGRTAADRVYDGKVADDED